MIAVNLGRKSNIIASQSFRDFSDIGTSWRTKDRIKDRKYVVLGFNKKLGLPLLDYTMNAFTPSFRPGGFNTTESLSEKAGGESDLEIPGSSGQFLAIW